MKLDLRICMNDALRPNAFSSSKHMKQPCHLPLTRVLRRHLKNGDGGITRRLNNAVTRLTLSRKHIEKICSEVVMLNYQYKGYPRRKSGRVKEQRTSEKDLDNIAEMTNMRVNAAAKAAMEREGWRSMASNLFKEKKPS
ncbi:hypothetical protein ElyMa_004546200 [Elysia marginata]|uniref:Tc3 transposase DNA binding domain-containing protein n=1 Tax=Elysia marginata TaxID=1093978 RepID=A0AAV4HPM8_9GAST|nr:hypothetical protein ElyMa_004546200 [Elysia marginata]